VFEIKKNPVGRYYFIFKDQQDQGLVVSKSFPDRSQLEICIAGIRDTAPIAAVFEIEEKQLPQFFIETKNNGYIFFLKGFDGNLILVSDPYQDKSECIKAIECLKNLAFNAGIKDSAML